MCAAAALILGYLFALNCFGRLFQAGQGWDNPLSWFASALAALVVVFAVAWFLTRAARWLVSRLSDH